jgi:hypothetical protein
MEYYGFNSHYWWPVRSVADSTGEGMVHVFRRHEVTVFSEHFTVWSKGHKQLGFHSYARADVAYTMVSKYCVVMRMRGGEYVVLD